MIAVNRSRTRAVTALKLASHEPQSRSIAVLVASEVVSGPGVSKMGSRSMLLIGCSLLYLSWRKCVTAEPLVSSFPLILVTELESICFMNLTWIPAQLPK
jgi:hypothetical protein